MLLRNEVRIATRVASDFPEIDVNNVAIEPERLLQISLGQENPRSWMNAAPGSSLHGSSLHEFMEIGASNQHTSFRAQPENAFCDDNG